MELIQPSILSGFMELSPEDQVLFNQMKAIVEKHFQAYGFWPLDTPAIEKTEVLFSKGGGETAKQVYRIERSDHSADQALRFDLTVPLARYVAQHSQELSFPFRRYQIAKVWRGERSQKGRYREFYQADIDIIGRDQLALLNDAEIPSVIDHIFQDLGLEGLVFHINHRALLNGFFQMIGVKDLEETLRAIDKLSKIGEAGVGDILRETGLSEEGITRIFDFIASCPSNEETLNKLHRLEAEKETNEAYRQGLSDLTRVYEAMQQFGIDPERIRIDLSITRGLDYYTGMVYETFIQGHESIGSVCSGGRYDDLASNFSKEKFPGIGISIGLTRLFYQLQAADLISWGQGDYLKALVIPMSEEEEPAAIKVVNQLRKVGLSSQLYSESGKMKKKFSYADRIQAAFVVIIGGEERAAGLVSLKNLKTGDQERLSLDEAIERIRQALSKEELIEKQAE